MDLHIFEVLLEAVKFTSFAIKTMARKVLSLEEYASYFDDIDPVAQFKRWTKTTKHLNLSRNSSELAPQIDVLSDRVKAVFIASDPVDWGRDIQVNLLRTLGKWTKRMVLLSTLILK